MLHPVLVVAIGKILARMGAAALGAFHWLHQTNVTFGDDFGNRQSVAALALGVLGYEPEMAGDKVVRRVAIVMLAPTLGVRVFFLAPQQR